MNEPTEVADAVRRVVAAITDEGPMRDYHRRLMARHRAEWPVLWDALDDLVAASPSPPEEV